MADRSHAHAKLGWCAGNGNSAKHAPHNAVSRPPSFAFSLRCKVLPYATLIKTSIDGKLGAKESASYFPFNPRMQQTLRKGITFYTSPSVTCGLLNLTLYICMYSVMTRRVPSHHISAGILKPAHALNQYVAHLLDFRTNSQHHSRVNSGVTTRLWCLRYVRNSRSIAPRLSSTQQPQPHILSCHPPSSNCALNRTKPSFRRNRRCEDSAMMVSRRRERPLRELQGGRRCAHRETAHGPCRRCIKALRNGR